MRRVIAIDGPSGAGKSTIAKLIAQELGFDYYDTGALYRAVALALRNSGLDSRDSDGRLKEVLRQTDISFSNEKVFLNGRVVSEEIRSKEIDHYSSVFSEKKIVRDFLFDTQRNAAATTDLVVEGRDIATVVFPDAWKKIYLDASLEERARRRYLQYKSKGIDISMEGTLREIEERDKRDSYRALAPLKRSDRALFIDSTNLSIKRVKEEILRYIGADR